MKKVQLQSYICIFSACLLAVMGIVQVNIGCVLDHSSELVEAHDHNHATTHLCDNHHHEAPEFHIRSAVAVDEIKAVERLIERHLIAEIHIVDFGSLYDKVMAVSAISNRYSTKHFSPLTMRFFDSIVILS